MMGWILAGLAAVTVGEVIKENGNNNKKSSDNNTNPQYAKCPHCKTEMMVSKSKHKEITCPGCRKTIVSDKGVLYSQKHWKKLNEGINEDSVNAHNDKKVQMDKLGKDNTLSESSTKEPKNQTFTSDSIIYEEIAKATANGKTDIDRLKSVFNMILNECNVNRNAGKIRYGFDMLYRYNVPVLAPMYGRDIMAIDGGYNNGNQKCVSVMALFTDYRFITNAERGVVKTIGFKEVIEVLKNDYSDNFQEIWINAYNDNYKFCIEKHKLLMMCSNTYMF